jgi:hypothetical protein
VCSGLDIRIFKLATVAPYVCVCTVHKYSTSTNNTSRSRIHGVEVLTKIARICPTWVSVLYLGPWPAVHFGNVLHCVGEGSRLWLPLQDIAGHYGGPKNGGGSFLTVWYARIVPDVCSGKKNQKTDLIRLNTYLTAIILTNRTPRVPFCSLVHDDSNGVSVVRRNPLRPPQSSPDFPFLAPFLCSLSCLCSVNWFFSLRVL